MTFILKLTYKCIDYFTNFTKFVFSESAANLKSLGITGSSKGMCLTFFVSVPL